MRNLAQEVAKKSEEQALLESKARRLRAKIGASIAEQLEAIKKGKGES